MEPVFTLPYSEYCVAQQLTRLLPARQGYSIYAPLSRQEKGVDLVVTRRRGRRTRAATIQVKSSRTYSRPTQTGRTLRPFKYYTWFNNFELPKQADFIALIALYPPEEARTRRRRDSWWAPVILVFSQREMRGFLRRVKTRRGTRDRMFGFGFDDGSAVFQTRGDQHRRYRDYSTHLLKRKVSEIKAFPGARR